MSASLVRSVHRAGPGTLRVTAFYPADTAGVDMGTIIRTKPASVRDFALLLIVNHAVNTVFASVANAFSAAAREKIEEAGGQVDVK